MEIFAFWVRSCVAATFVLSAFWKMRHHQEFLRLLKGMGGSRPLARGLGALVPVVELVVAVLLVVPGMGRIGAFAAAVLIVGLSSTLFRSDLTAGCGCWSAANTGRGLLVARNVVLLVLALGAAALPAASVGPAAAALLPIGALFGLVIMEIPAVAQYLVDAEGTPS